MNRTAMVLAVGVWTGASAGAAPPEILATDPPSLRARVTAGTATAPDGRAVIVQPLELSFDPPAMAEAKSVGPIPGSYKAGVPDREQMHGWDTFTPLPPENPQILGYFYRGIPASSLVLKNHDGTKTFEPGVDYVFSSEMGQVLSLQGRLGRRAADLKNPKPEERLQATFRYYCQRLDLVQTDAEGRVSVKKGESVIMCPPLPAPDAGCVALAGVWVYGAHGTGPAPERPEDVAIAPADICPIAPRPPVAPVNAPALAPAVKRLAAGQPIGVGFFGDSIAVGAETPDWYFYIYSPQNRGFVGMVIRDLRARFPAGDVQPTWGIAGAQSIFNEGLWSNVLGRATASTGAWTWWEAEDGAASGGGETVPEEFDLKTPDEVRVLSGGRWRVVAPGEGAEYGVDVPAGGPLRFFVREAHNRGRLRWRWDDGAWSEQAAPLKPTDADDIRRGLALCWYDLGEADVKPGRHTLRIEAVGAPAAVDAFALTADARGPWRRHRPGELKVDVVVYAMGMNGSFNEKTPREQHKATILRHIAEARAAGAEVLLVATMENNGRLVGDPEKSKRPNRDLLAEIAAETGCAFADVYTEWMNQESRGIPPEARLHNFINHPGAEGHRLWADTILRCFDAARGTSR